MADPIRLIVQGYSAFVHPNRSKPSAAYIVRSEPLAMAIRILSREELRVWYEPDWRTAKMISRRFPHVMVCSIPEESNTANLRKTPGWRYKKHNGAVL